MHLLKKIRSYVNALVSLNLCIIEFIKHVEVSDKMRGLSSVLSIILNEYKNQLYMNMKVRLDLSFKN